MPETASLLAFVAASLVVVLMPGPGVLYVVTRSLMYGQRAGIVSVLGLSAGALVQVAAATIGLSVILLTSAAAFTVVKLLGAGYLIYLGVAALLGRHTAVEVNVSSPHSQWRLFIDGVIVSVLNPKIAVFFLAFLPQFIEPGRGPITRQVLCLGLLYVALALCTDSAYAILAARLRGWLGPRFMRRRLPQYASGAVYIGLGLGAALAERR